jgi:hypothetical protein
MPLGFRKSSGGIETVTWVRMYWLDRDWRTIVTMTVRQLAIAYQLITGMYSVGVMSSRELVAGQHIPGLTCFDCGPLYLIWHHSSSTTIESRKFRIPSDLRRQPGYRPVSSKVGDHLRILLGVVVHLFLRWVRVEGRLRTYNSYTSKHLLLLLSCDTQHMSCPPAACKDAHSSLCLYS